MHGSSRWAALGLTALLAAAPALGGQAAAVSDAPPAASAPVGSHEAAAPASSHEAAARELVRITDLMRLALDAGGGMIDAQLKANSTMAPYADVMHTWLAHVLQDIDLEGIVVKLYMESFSEAELRDLIAFYRTPTGRKALTVMPQLMQKGMALGMEKAQEHTAELQQLIAKRKQELEGKPGSAKPPA
jgi:hypothetical protein